MPCSHCKQPGHNRRTCLNISKLAVVNSVATNVVSFALSSAMSNVSIALSDPIKPPAQIVPIVPTVPTCVICLEDLGDQPQTQLACTHAFCTNCIMKNMSMGNTNCPMCREPIIEPNAEITDLKHQITTLEQLVTTTNSHMVDIIRQLNRLRISSPSDLTQFINEISDYRSIINSYAQITGVSFDEMSANLFGERIQPIHLQSRVDHSQIPQPVFAAQLSPDAVSNTRDPVYNNLNIVVDDIEEINYIV